MLIHRRRLLCSHAKFSDSLCFEFLLVNRIDEDKPISIYLSNISQMKEKFDRSSHRLSNVLILTIHIKIITYCVYYRPQRSSGKVMFLHLSVSHSVHRGVGWGWCLPLVRGLYATHTSPLGTHPQADTPPGQAPLGRHPPGHTPPGKHPQANIPPWSDTPLGIPPSPVHAEIHTPLPSACWDTSLPSAWWDTPLIPPPPPSAPPPPPSTRYIRSWHGGRNDFINLHG